MSSAKKKITLKSSDGVSVEVDEDVALEFLVIKLMIEDGADNGIPLPNVTRNTLDQVHELLKKHFELANSEDRTSEDDLKAWVAEISRVDDATLFDIINAANYLNIRCLLDPICRTVLDRIKGKTPEEIRKIFNIESDFTLTPKEKAAANHSIIETILDLTYRILVERMAEKRKIEEEMLAKGVQVARGDTSNNHLCILADDLVVLIKAAKNLNIEHLVDLACETLADIRTGQTTAEMGDLYHQD